MWLLRNAARGEGAMAWGPPWAGLGGGGGRGASPGGRRGAGAADSRPGDLHAYRSPAVEANLGELFGALAVAVPERTALVEGARRLTWSALADRARRLGHVLAGAGLGCHVERDRLAPHQSGQDHLAICLKRGLEHVEATLGAYAARVAPCAVNTRYGPEELRHVLAHPRVGAVLTDAATAPAITALLPDLPHVRLALDVDDGSYEEALAAAPPGPVPLARPPSPDDLCVLPTGGTTGRPKAVLWRQADLFVAALGGRRDDGREYEGLDQVVAVAVQDPSRALVLAPLSHGTGQWGTFHTLHRGGTVVLADPPRPGEGDPLWELVAREQVDTLHLVGEAFARPLLDALPGTRHDLSALTVVLSGGAPLSARSKQDLLHELPWVMIVDGLGSSETGGLAQEVSVAGSRPARPGGTFRPAATTRVLAEARDRELTPGEDEVGWLATVGRLPLGLLDDPDGTAATYPVVGGVRYGLSGDRARLRSDGTIEHHGRDETTVNTAGEKVFVEEVEAALRQHPDVVDVVVVGCPSARWGEEVVAVVQLAAGARFDRGDLLATAGRHVARYKLPKRIVVVPEVQRGPSGKPDLLWARGCACGEPPSTLAT